MMKRIKKITLPYQELIIFTMITICAIVLSSILIESDRMSKNAKYLTESVTIAQSTAECYLGCGDIDEFVGLVNGEFKNDAIFYSQDGYDIVCEETIIDGLSYLSINVLREETSIYQLTVSKLSGGKDE